MVNNQLLEYVKHQLSLNVTKEVIISSLKSQGWTEIDINEAFETLRLASMAPAPQAVPAAPSPAVSPLASVMPAATVATPAMTTMPYTTVTYSEYAGFWRRFVASLVDGSLIGLIMIILTVLMTLVGLTNKILIQVIPIILSLLYPVWLESSKWQGTIGKHLMGLKVTDASGARISFLRALGRNFAKFISAIPFMIGFIMAGFTAKKQGLHDIIAGTLVVKEKPAKTGLVLLSIFGPMILFFIAMFMFASMIFGMLGFGLGSMFGGSLGGPSIFSESDIKESSKNMDLNLKPLDEYSDLTIGTMTKGEYDTFFNTLSLKDRTPTEPGDHVGPGIVELDLYYKDEPRVALDLPKEMEALGDNYKVYVDFDHIYKTDQEDIKYGNVFMYINPREKLDGGIATADPQYYYRGESSISLKDDISLEYKTFDKAIGTLVFELPTSDNMIYTKKYPFEIKSEYTKYDAFAQCLDTSGAKFYGASWCDHCTTQKEMFGPSAEYLPFVECAVDGNADKQQSKACNQAKIRYGFYPTWVFKDGTREEGIQELETLAEKTQCTLPN